jgi:hypothetical protein
MNTPYHDFTTRVNSFYSVIQFGRIKLQWALTELSHMLESGWQLVNLKANALEVAFQAI